MNELPAPPHGPPTGDYVCHYPAHTEANVQMAQERLRNAGCRSHRVEVNANGSISVHGFLTK